MAEQKINWIGKLEPNTEEALTMFEALKKDEIANQAQLRLARISGRCSLCSILWEIMT